MESISIASSMRAAQRKAAPSKVETSFAPKLSGRRLPGCRLQAFARRSFGTYQEMPVKVALRFDARAAPNAATFLFHPDQTVEENDDETVTVRFKAGGLDEMCWHLVTWGDSVTVEQPARLRQRLAAMCEGLAGWHGAAYKQRASRR